MSFFEQFIPKSKKIEKDDTSNLSVDSLESVGAKKELSFDDIDKQIKESLKIKEIISGEDTLEPHHEEVDASENLAAYISAENETINNNIDIVIKEIKANEDKIKQLDISIQRTRQEMSDSQDSTLTISIQTLERMRASLEKLNEEKTKFVESELEKIEMGKNPQIFN